MTGLVYRVVSQSDLAQPVMLDDYTLIYHRPSGATHLLAEPAPEILAALGDGPATPAEMLARLRDDYGLESEGDAEPVIAARMAELAELGLIVAA